MQINLSRNEIEVSRLGNVKLAQLIPTLIREALACFSFALLFLFVSFFCFFGYLYTYLILAFQNKPWRISSQFVVDSRGKLVTSPLFGDAAQISVHGGGGGGGFQFDSGLTLASSGATGVET